MWTKLGWTSNTYARWILASYAVFFIVGSISRVAILPLWSDEGLTHYVSSLPSIRNIWDALAAGADGHPPLNYLLERGITSIFGENFITFRIPAIIGYLIFAWCLYVFVSRRTTPLYGVIAALFLSLTHALTYAWEARPYGPALGCLGIMLVCWQAAADGRRRWMALPGLALAYAAAISLHYYSIFLAIPFGVGEAVRLIQRRKPDYGMWTAAVLGASTFLVLLPLIRTQMAGSGTFGARPTAQRILEFYDWLLGPALVALIFVLLTVTAYAVVRTWLSAKIESDAGAQVSIPLPEIGLAISLALYPFIIAVIAITVTHAYNSRYGLPAVAGISALLAYGTADFGRKLSPTRAFLVLAPALAWFALYQLYAVKNAIGTTPETSVALELPPNDLPLVVGSHDFVELLVARPDLKSRLYFLADRTSAVRFLGYDTDDRFLSALSPFAHLPVAEYDDFVKAHKSFLLLDRADWVLPKVLEQGYRAVVVDELKFRLAGLERSALLFQVSRP
jgi:hypothetical protein